MSYRAGTRGLSPLGILDGDPCIICDGCGFSIAIGANGRMPPTWFLDGKAPPKWAKVQRIGTTRIDKCPTCKEPTR